MIVKIDLKGVSVDLRREANTKAQISLYNNVYAKRKQIQKHSFNCLVMSHMILTDIKTIEDKHQKKKLL